MRRYELNLLLNAALQESSLLDFLGSLVSFIQDQGGLLETQEIKGKKTFHGAGKNQKEATLAALVFSFNPDYIEALKKRVVGDASVIRSFLAHARVKVVQKQKVVPVLQPLVSQEPAVTSQEKPVNISEIDKKLEEIFKEN